VSKVSLQRQTIVSVVEIAGLGVRCREQITVRLVPAEAGSGIRLTRSDLDITWPVDLEHVRPVPNCSAIGDQRGEVAFVEHLMAALWAAGISDVRIDVDGPELPLLDGSALPFWTMLQEAGVQPLAGEFESIRVTEPIFQVDGEKALIALPAESVRFSYSLVHPHPMIGHQFADFDASLYDFGEELAPARTFVTDDELGKLREAGLIGGGSEENCLIVHENGYSEQPFAGNAFARHKLVDLLGDLYLLGRPLQAHVVAYRTGHIDNRALCRRLIQTSG
jgi:UDP-3-O-acyl N-acetylglucosamine deacetylase